MQLIAPGLLAPLLGLSKPACGVGIGVGVLLWLFGWLGHRFWIVCATTVAAGVIGLSSGRAAGLTPLVAGVLLAISAGMMALALARVLAFVAGGAAVCLALQLLVPTWEDRLLWFLGGGLAGLFLFRWWLMALTSLAGTLLITYSSLCLLQQMGRLQALDWTEKRTLLLNWIVVGGTLLGMVGQMLVERVRKQMKRARDEEAHLQRAEMELEQRMRKQKSWWQFGKSERRAA